MSSKQNTGFQIAMSVVLAGAMLVAGAQESASDEAQSSSEQAQADAIEVEVSAPSITFRVPLRGAPKMRVGGGVRGADALDVALNALVPEEAGLTIKPSPTVYWYLSTPATAPVEIAFTDTTSLEVASVPVLVVNVAPPVSAGVHALDLAEHGIALAAGVEYQWFVAVVTDPTQRSKDLIAGGALIFQPPDSALEGRLGQVGKDVNAKAIFLADAGIWYDALDQLSREIARDPIASDTRELRAELLDQVGLGDVADYDRRGGG